MAKIEIQTSAASYPMPVSLVGSMVDGQPNFMTCAWFSKVNKNPPLMAAALFPKHHTTRGIRETEVFSINIPGPDLVSRVDYCGNVSGKRADKSKVFDVFYGKLRIAPMISDCPICLELRLVDSVPLGYDHLYIGEIVGAHADEELIEDGKYKLTNANPFIYNMSNDNYMVLGKSIGIAGESKEDYKPESGDEGDSSSP